MEEEVVKASEKLRAITEPNAPVEWFDQKTWGEFIQAALDEMEGEADERERKAFEAGRRTNEIEAGMGTRKTWVYETFDDYKREQAK
jgi:hypothetical protein